MLIVGDFKALEWNTCVFLAQDKVGIQELNTDGYDMHAINQNTLGLPDRLRAKKFIFRLIFGGTASTYAHDPEFRDISSKKSFWEGVIDAFYTKYNGVKEWHESLMRQVVTTGKIVLPTGRYYQYQAEKRGGEFVWPRTTILNYPVQGLGADLMVIARVLLRRKMRRLNLKSQMICTVHDSIVIDGPEDEVKEVTRLFHETWEQIPHMFVKLYGVEYNIKCRVEVKSGPNWGELKDED